MILNKFRIKFKKAKIILASYFYYHDICIVITIQPNQNLTTMTTITLNTAYTYQENSTSKYWRDIQCQPQTVELKTWGVNKPFFIMKGIVVSSHDEREIGKIREVYIQTYMFELEVYINNGTYTIN